MEHVKMYGNHPEDSIQTTQKDIWTGQYMDFNNRQRDNQSSIDNWSAIQTKFIQILWKK